MHSQTVASRIGTWGVGVFANAVLSLSLPSFVLPAFADSGAETIADSEEYFPDAKGSQWRYRGRIVESPIQTIGDNGFINVSTVQGAETLKGISVKAFHDTNPGNHGPSDSYYRRDAAGIVYYGSQPGTPLEKQLVPYQIVRFPLVLSSSFQQLNRKGLTLGSDLDGDGKEEPVDVESTVTVIGKETVQVPAGTYRDALRIEAKMTMRIRLTSSDRPVFGTDIMTAWFAKGVGLVKYIERQELPPAQTGRGMSSEIMEELEEVMIKKTAASRQTPER